ARGGAASQVGVPAEACRRAVPRRFALRRKPEPLPASAKSRVMRRVLAFRHVPFEGLGRIEPELRERGIQADYADLYQPGAPSPDLANYAALIVLGGPMSIHDDLDHLRREESYIREAIARGTPVLGVCLGAQLIAHSLGAEVRKNPVKEIGWFELNLTTAAQHDPVFAGLGPRESVFHWHGEMFDLPAGAALFASSRPSADQSLQL